MSSADSADADAIDAVVAWVDGNDPRHRAKLDAYLSSIGRRPAAAAPTRFRSAGEIDWCITSLLRHAPFLRRIHVVTDDQVPSICERARHWPQALRDKLVVVDHRAIFAGHEDVLPTFNSLAIETVVHRIAGLAERFVYLNDDFMVIRQLEPSDWFAHRMAVLRGRFEPMPGRRVIDRLRKTLRRLTQRPGTPPRPSYMAAQALAARLAGFDDRFLPLAHQPHPMQRSLLEDFYNAHPALLRSNIEPRLRDGTQFLPQGLAAHLALGACRARVEPDTQLLYLKPASASRARLARQLSAAKDDQSLLFACVQSLDEASPLAQQQVIDGLRGFIGALDDGP
jgi:Stealth protein CR2, conserved region 2/Stealth protein CR1, conserved region 1